MGYRSTLSFCRECGAVWAEGASVCTRCGTPRTRAPVVSDGASTVRGLFSAAGLYFVLLGTLLAPLLIESDDVLGTLDTLLVVDTLIVTLWAVAHRRDLAEPLRNLGEARYWGLALAAVPVTVALAAGNLWFATEVLGGFDVDLVSMYLGAGYSLPLVLLLFAVQPAIIEELAFRGIMFARLEPVVEPAAAIVITAIGFTVLHLTLLSAVFLVALGLITGWLRYKSGSLYPAMLLHLLHNGTVALLSFYGAW